MMFSTSYTADAALVAVVLALVDVVQKDARRTPIGAQRHTARATDLRRVLHGFAACALDRGDGVPVHRVGLFPIGCIFALDLVVAKTAAEPLAAAGGEQSSLSLVMGAAFV
jgi:hypothetical protein